MNIMELRVTTRCITKVDTSLRYDQAQLTLMLRKVKAKHFYGRPHARLALEQKMK